MGLDLRVRPPTQGVGHRWPLEHEEAHGPGGEGRLEGLAKLRVVDPHAAAPSEARRIHSPLRGRAAAPAARRRPRGSGSAGEAKILGEPGGGGAAALERHRLWDVHGAPPAVEARGGDGPLVRGVRLSDVNDGELGPPAQLPPQAQQVRGRAARRGSRVRERDDAKGLAVLRHQVVKPPAARLQGRQGHVWNHHASAEVPAASAVVADPKGDFWVAGRSDSELVQSVLQLWERRGR